MNNLNDPDDLKKQYSNTNNFKARILLSKYFSTNKYGWNKWVFDQITFPPNAKVLELGCGLAGLWKHNLAKVPKDADILLSDFSNKMLSESRHGLNSENFKFAIVNAMQIPLPDLAFDIILANHMLYHVPDRNKAFSEISRILKNEGTLYATTVGKNNMKELHELFCDCFSVSNSKGKSVADEFGLENGMEQLKNHFNDITLKRYENSLEVTDAEPLVNYMLSAEGVSKINEFMTPKRIDYFTNYLKETIEKNKFIKITKESGIFIAENKRKT